MSEMILRPWLNDGLERVSLAVEVLRLRLELAGAQHVSDHPNGEYARLVEEAEVTAREAVDACESFSALLTVLWKNAWRSVGRREGVSWNSAGEDLRSLFDDAIRVMELARRCVETYERSAGRPAGLERVDRALAEARRVRADLETNWLWFTKEAEEEARASIARGEGVEVEEAFARMAGLSVEALRAKVEAHQRKYHPNGDGAR